MAHGRLWTEEEEDLLAEYWGKFKLKLIAQKLNRTEKAVLMRGYQLGLGARKDAQGHLTIRGLAKICSVEGKTIKNIWIKNGLKCKKIDVKTRNGRMTQIIIDDFWKWAEKHKELVNFAKIERHMLLPEPEWFLAEREKDKIEIPKQYNQKWNKYEDSKLLNYLKMGLNYDEIAEKMNRTARAIVRRKERLVSKEVMQKTKHQKLWKESEIEQLIKLKEQGATYKEIANELNRTLDSVRGQARKLRRENVC